MRRQSCLHQSKRLRVLRRPTGFSRRVTRTWAGLEKLEGSSNACARSPRSSFLVSFPFETRSTASFSCRACAWRPARRNEPDPPPRRDPCRRCRGVFAPHGSGRGRHARTAHGVSGIALPIELRQADHEGDHRVGALHARDPNLEITMTEAKHRTVETNGIRMHVAEQGAGPLVVLCHGFPESWYSWRHQLRGLAEAGFHAVAPDMRGYGQTDRPEAIERYTLLHMVGDMVGLVDALGAETAVIAGHDWGAPVAWRSALLRPDRFRGVIGLSGPYLPRGPVRP